MDHLYRRTLWFQDKLDNIDHAKETQDMLQVTKHAGRKPFSSLLDWGIYFPHFAQCVRLKKFAYPQVSGMVMADSRLKSTINQTTEDIYFAKHVKEHGTWDDNANLLHENSEFRNIYKQQEKRAQAILTDMRSKLSDLMLRITSWILYKLLPCFLSGVVAHMNQIEMLKSATQKAPGVPLIFLPLHRSHLDYIMVSFILLNYDIRSPIVAAGNNLRIPVFGSLLRKLGAFFIKRKIDPVVGQKDVLYRAILHFYLQHALKAGHNVEFFIEGGRTRTGKPCMPKNGILSVIVNAFMDGTIPDALLVPVSVNYEKLVDGNFVNEQLGKRKEPETFRSAISAIWKIINSRYGLMRIDFNEPFSIRDLVQSFNKVARESGSTTQYTPATRQLQHNKSSSSLYGTDVVCEEHRTLVDSISRTIVYDCAAATSVMTTNAIAFLCLTRFRDGTTINNLAAELDRLRRILFGRKDMGFSGDSTHIVRYACEILGPSLIVVTQETDGKSCFIKPNTIIPNCIELAYYSNALVPHFALESVVVTALSNLLEKRPKNESEIPLTELKDACLDHCEILRNEFILSKPTQNLDQLLDTTIDDLCIKEIICRPQQEDAEPNRFKVLANYLEQDYSDDEDDYMHDEMKLHLNSVGNDDRIALINVLAPISHTYSVVAQTLNRLVGSSMIETQFIKTCIQNIINKIEDKDCIFGESVSTEYVKNCMKLLEKWGVLKLSNQHGVRLVLLEDDYNTMSALNPVIERIKAIVPENPS